MAEQQEHFGERLRRLRQAAGYSQEMLAERAGLSANAISALERGERKRPYPDTLRRLAEALRLDDDARASLAASLRPPATTPPAPDPPSTPVTSELPGEPTPLIGRGREAEVVRHLLAHMEGQLLSLTGPGGVGKTRLALHVARSVVDDYPHGVVWVELAPLNTPTLVLPTIARALGLEDALRGGDPREILRGYLRHRRALLVLDNFEHVLDAAPEMAELLRSCPDLRVLATSRAPLNMRGEQEYTVPPLELPPADSAPERGEAVEVSALQLFAWYARQKSPSFALTEETTPVVAAICRRLDGLPLALELAAARVRVLSPAELLTRLDHLLPLLVGGSRDLPRRQQTMWATIDWSYQLLGAAGQTLFRRLSVCAGDWTLETAEAVAGWGEIAPEAVIDLLSHLVEQSLVMVDHSRDGGNRYRMLEPIRQFAAHRVEAMSERVELHDHHLAWYLMLAKQAEAGLVGPDQQRWLDRLAQEHDNLRVALAWSQEHPPARTSGLALAAALWGFWSTRGHLTEGRHWLESALATADDAPADVRASALNAAGNLADDQGDYARAAELIGAGLELRRTLGDREAIGKSLNDLGNTMLSEGRYDQASERYEQALALFREVGFDLGIAIALHNTGFLARHQGSYERAATLLEEALVLWERLGNTASRARSLNVLAVVMRLQGDLARAETLHQQSLALRQSLGDTRGIAVTLWNYGVVLRHQGKYMEATRMIEESLRLHRLIGDQSGVAGSLLALADVARSVGDLGRAEELYRESIAVRRRLETSDGLADCLIGLAAIAMADGHPTRAAVLLGASEALREARNEVVPPVERSEYERTVASIERGLPPADYSRAQAEGRGMTLEQVIADEIDGHDRA